MSHWMFATHEQPDCGGSCSSDNHGLQRRDRTEEIKAPLPNKSSPTSKIPLASIASIKIRSDKMRQDYFIISLENYTNYNVVCD